jgi:hypothetical protein
MLRIIPFVLVGVFAFSSKPAHASPATPLYYGVQVGTLVMGGADLGSSPTSKAYGGFEIAVGGTAAAMSSYAAYEFATDTGCTACNNAAPIAIGLAIVDLAVVAHGTYLVTRRDEKPARVQLAPTVVGTHDKSPGLAVVGRF